MTTPSPGTIHHAAHPENAIAENSSQPCARSRRTILATFSGCPTVKSTNIATLAMLVRSVPEWRRQHVHLTVRLGKKNRQGRQARRLAVRMYWMMRKSNLECNRLVRSP